jgi:hypothetical protein
MAEHPEPAQNRPRINRVLCEWVERFRALPDFDAQERDYKFKAIKQVAVAMTMILNGTDGWLDPLRRGFRNQDNNITNWQAADTFLKWVAANPDNAKMALTALWTEGADGSRRVRAFLDLIPGEAIATPGNRLNVASYLLMAADPKTYPPYKTRAIKAALELAGWQVPPARPEDVAYGTFLNLCDGLVDSCPSLRDRLDAQGALWAITKWKRQDKPPSWTDAEWAELVALRGGTPVTVASAQSDRSISVRADDLIAKAADNLHLDRSVLDDIVDLLEDKKQVILYGPPGTGKTYLAKTLANALASGDPARSTVVQFHPGMSYEDFVEGFRPEETSAGQVMYTVRPGHLLRMVKHAVSNGSHRHVMVIDEINRANLPKVLGELLFLLEYRDEAIPLLYHPEDRFSLPKNLWFIGTMNTADRSIALIDAALRRRFHFVPFFPTQPPMDDLLDQFLEDSGFSSAPAAFLQGVNSELQEKYLIDEHVLIGPSHFMNTDHYVDGFLKEKTLERIWTYNIFPLIEELLWGQRDAIDSWRWPKVKSRFATELEVGQPSQDSAGDGVGGSGTTES